MGIISLQTFPLFLSLSLSLHIKILDLNLDVFCDK